MNRKYDYNRIFAEYVILFFGLIASLFFNFLFDYDFQINNKIKNYQYTYSYNTIILTIGYLSGTGYLFLILLSPVLGNFFKKLYQNFFNLLMIVNGLWMLFLIIGKGGQLILLVPLICSPMPISYLFARRLNAQYWRNKESKAEPAL